VRETDRPDVVDLAELRDDAEVRADQRRQSATRDEEEEGQRDRHPRSLVIRDDWLVRVDGRTRGWVEAQEDQAGPNLGQTDDEEGEDEGRRHGRDAGEERGDEQGTYAPVGPQLGVSGESHWPILPPRGNRTVSQIVDGTRYGVPRLITEPLRTAERILDHP